MYAFPSIVCFRWVNGLGFGGPSLFHVLVEEFYVTVSRTEVRVSQLYGVFLLRMILESVGGIETVQSI